jgi:Proteasome subunit
MLKIFLFLIISSTTMLATTLVGIRGRDGFVIAADSKVTYKGNGINGPATACKIYRSGSLYFAIAGMAYDRNRGFFPAKIVADSFSTSRSFASNIESMERALSDSLILEMKKLNTENHDEFERIQRDGGEVFTVLAAVMVGDTPQMAGRGFMYVDEATPGIEIHRKSCPGDCPGGEYVFFGGQQQAARQTTNELFKSPGRGLGAVEFARKLVEAEIQASPEDVGPPVTILAVDKNGAAMVPNDNGCPIVVEPAP